MGFRQPNLTDARNVISQSLIEISSPYNDGFTASYCKKDLYLLKCWLEDQYNQLPKFSGEQEWEQERIVELLRK
jgi:hypothetical protein